MLVKTSEFLGEWWAFNRSIVAVKLMGWNIAEGKLCENTTNIGFLDSILTYTQL